MCSSSFFTSGTAACFSPGASRYSAMEANSPVSFCTLSRSVIFGRMARPRYRPFPAARTKAIIPSLSALEAQTAKILLLSRIGVCATSFPYSRINRPAAKLRTTPRSLIRSKFIFPPKAIGLSSVSLTAPLSSSRQVSPLPCSGVRRYFIPCGITREKSRLTTSLMSSAAVMLAIVYPTPCHPPVPADISS